MSPALRSGRSLNSDLETIPSDLKPIFNYSDGHDTYSVEGSEKSIIFKEPIVGCCISGKCNKTPYCDVDDGSCAPDLTGVGGTEGGIDCNGICGGSAQVRTYYYDDDGDGLGCN